MGNSLRRALLRRGKMEATRGWTDGKLWEIELGESSVGKERDGSDDRVDGGEIVGNSLGRAPLGGSDILRSRAVGTGFQDKFQRPRLFKWFASVGRWDMHSFVGRERH